MEVETVVAARYTGETAEESLGCANLWPHLGVKEGISVLDLGCGNGSQAVRIAQLAGPTGFSAGIDLTPAMIAKAMARPSAYPVDFRLGDIHALPWSGGRFDLVVSNCVINHARDKERVYSEIFRVLKRGGAFLVGDVMSRERLPEIVSSDPEAVADCWGGAIPKEEYLQTIIACGFDRVEILESRSYQKNGYGMESAVIRVVKP